MSQNAHHSTVELANCKLRLRDDLSFHLQEYRESQCYLIEDELNSRFYRVGLAEYHLISLLDGHTTLSRAVAMSATQMGDQAVAEMEAVTICKWLIDSGLASTDASRSANRLIESHNETSRKKNIAKLNPITPKFPLFNPDRFLEQLNGVCGWLFSTPMFALWAIIVFLGGYHVWADWDKIGNGQTMVFSADNWLWLGLTWIGLKLFHELAHGIVCKRHQGEVRQAGIVLILMIPLPYVDVTSSWRFRSKWHRVQVAAAGMYVEMFLAAVAAIIWSHADVGVLKQQAFNIMLAGSFTTLIFNANPLMRFDGYYILTDWLELPNLGTHGQQLTKWFGKKFYLGLDVKKPSWPEGRGEIVVLYALGALAWKVLICVGLAIAAESLFFGAGILLAAIAVCLWVVWPIIKLLKFVFVGVETQQRPSRIRFCGLTAILIAGLFSIYHYVPWHARIHAPAIVDFVVNNEVRVPVGGFLSEILVADQELVEPGRVIARLTNLDLTADVKKLEIELLENQMVLRKLRQDDDLSAFEAELKNRDSLTKRLQERSAQLEDLEIRAQETGMIVADDLDSMVGVYLSAGHMLCRIGSNEHKEVKALVSQTDIKKFQDRDGAAVDVLITGNGTQRFSAVLNQVNPRANVELPHEAFSSMVGGPMPVRSRSSAPDTFAGGENQDQFQLVRPHFLARVSLSPLDSRKFRAGQAATVSFRAKRGSVGDVISEKVTNWLRNMRSQIQ
jgi:putative peptide zinc metalloprotease protein